MDVISNDDVAEVWVRKSARVGYTKIILAAMGYFAEHKRRNQCVWQPSDDDSDEFVKVEIETMIRDVSAVRDIFPWHETQSKKNTMKQKSFIGSTLHMRGGKSGKNFRRLTIGVGYLDELDGFDRDIDKEGSAPMLAGKRLEGATFPKLIGGSTPKIKATSQIIDRADNADAVFRYYVPCPHCDHMQWLQFGGKDTPYGLKYGNRDPSTAAYLCESCGALFDQSEYLGVWMQGRWQTEDGLWLDDTANFRDSEGSLIPAPRSVGFVDLWTIYSPQASWSDIAREWLDAQSDVDPTRLKTFVNTTLGQGWDHDIKTVESKSLLDRREEYAAEVPWGGVLLTAGVDIQEDRIEVQVDAWGIGEERWTIDYEVIPGDPAMPEPWDDLEQFFQRRYRHESGIDLPIWSAVLDTGYLTQMVYEYCQPRYRRRIFAIKDVEGEGRPLVSAPTRKGTAKTVRKVALFTVGKWEANYRTYSALSVEDNSEPRYWHFPDAEWCDKEYFEQLTGEVLFTVYKNGIPEKVWKKRRPRQEVLSVSNYSLVALHLSSKNHKRLLMQCAQNIAELSGKPAAAETKPAQPPRTKQPEAPAESTQQSAPAGRSGRRRRRAGSSYLTR